MSRRFSHRQTNETSPIWTAIAKARAARGDKEGAARARFAARVARDANMLDSASAARAKARELVLAERPEILRSKDSAA